MENKQTKNALYSTGRIYDISKFSSPNLNLISDMHLPFVESEGNCKISFSSKGLKMQQSCKMRP